MKKNKSIYPLRKIDYVVRGLSNAGFMSTNLVHLECGHDVSVSTATTYRARCYKCLPNNACTGQLTGAGKADGESTPPANCQ